ncbi:Hypothetical predicted protein [Podarcis lilfordi]|uniref:Uncharacterized protein n=1 Tax=Podarcis lilfordi TaxID=74358 RepID=A0AA35LE66_9SAUR|nr:Hypothetical predicted protein [Podarcis lilfordi]
MGPALRSHTKAPIVTSHALSVAMVTGHKSSPVASQEPTECQEPDKEVGPGEKEGNYWVQTFSFRLLRWSGLRKGQPGPGWEPQIGERGFKIARARALEDELSARRLKAAPEFGTQRKVQKIGASTVKVGKRRRLKSYLPQNQREREMGSSSSSRNSRESMAGWPASALWSPGEGSLKDGSWSSLPPTPRASQPQVAMLRNAEPLADSMLCYKQAAGQTRCPLATLLWSKGKTETGSHGLEGQERVMCWALLKSSVQGGALRCGLRG